MNTIRELLNIGHRRLKESSQTPYLDAQVLMMHVLGCEKTHLFAHGDDQVEANQEADFLRLIAKRQERCPVQYLTNMQEFMGLSFFVDERVLIPRPDTEILVQAVLDHASGEEEILDIGTGSGAIAIALDLMMPDSRVSAVDLSEGALAVARENARRLGANISFYKGDMLQPVGDSIYNIIVSNPPYIKQGDYEDLMPDVKEYEPVSALVAEEEGLWFYRRITEDAWDHLVPGGLLAFEIGYDQGEAVMNILALRGYQNLKIIQDLAGHDRVVLGSRGE